MYVRCRLSAFAVEARRRRPAWLTCEPATRTAKEGADDCIQRDSRQSGDRCVVRAGCDSGWRFLTATARAEQVPSARSTTETPGNSAREARIQRLRQALDQESQRAIYRWHDAEHPSPPTWFDKLLVKIGHSIEHAWNTLWDFLHKLWPRGLSLSSGN